MTIKQLADQLGTNKQAVRRTATRCGFVLAQKNGVIHLTDDQVNAISARLTGTENRNSSGTETGTVVAVLLQQLEIKDEQIRTLTSQIETLTRLLDQQQQLQAVSLKGLPEPGHSRSLLNRIFGKKESQID